MLAQRNLVPERMDMPDLGGGELDLCLRHLEAVNRASGAYRPTLAWLARLPRLGRPLRILDVGSGRGDMARRIAAWAARRGLAVEIVAADRNPLATRAARAATPDHLPVRHVTADVFALAEPCDVIVSALFAHHLDDGEIVRFLRWMEGRARLGWFVNDLHRHPLPYWVVRGLAAALPVSPVVAHDAPVSVARAFTAADWRRYLAAAGLAGTARLEWFFPFRLCLGRVR